MLILQSTASSVTVRIFDNTGVPHVGIAATSVTGFIRKQGATAFSTFPVTVGNFSNLGNGYYAVGLSATDTNTVGSVTVLLQSTLFEDALIHVTVVGSSASLPAGPSISVTTGSVYGVVRTGDGSPLVNATVTAVPVGAPIILSSGVEGVIVSNKPITTKTDSTGYFVISTIVGLTLDVYIPAVNYRATVVMPAGSANIADL